MTRDFTEDLTEALDKEGYEYLILTWKDLSLGACVDSNIKGLKEDFEFSERVITKRESIIELISLILSEDEDNDQEPPSKTGDQ